MIVSGNFNGKIEKHEATQISVIVYNKKSIYLDHESKLLAYKDDIVHGVSNHLIP